MQLALRFVAGVVSLPRITRILIAGVFAVMTTLAVSPIVDEIYIRYLYSPSTVILPSFVSAGFGIVMYLVGWQLIVGVVGEAVEVRTAIVWYFVVGVLAHIVVGLWLLRLIAL